MNHVVCSVRERMIENMGDIVKNNKKPKVKKHRFKVSCLVMTLLLIGMIGVVPLYGEAILMTIPRVLFYEGPIILYKKMTMTDEEYHYDKYYKPKEVVIGNVVLDIPKAMNYGKWGEKNRVHIDALLPEFGENLENVRRYDYRLDQIRLTIRAHKNKLKNDFLQKKIRKAGVDLVPKKKGKLIMYREDIKKTTFKNQKKYVHKEWWSYGYITEGITHFIHCEQHMGSPTNRCSAHIVTDLDGKHISVNYRFYIDHINNWPHIAGEVEELVNSIYNKEKTLNLSKEEEQWQQTTAQ